MPWAISSDGSSIFYDWRGSGPAIVFVSGYLGVADIWTDQVSDLERDFTCIVMDNRGYGRSDAPTQGAAYQIDQLVEDVRTVIDTVGVDGRIVLVGHSMGGSTISSFALHYPGRVAGLVYVGSHLSGPQLAEVGDSVAAIQEGLASPAQRSVFYTEIGLPRAIANETAKWPLHGLIGNAQTMMAYDIGERFREIQAPTLVIHGGDDQSSPLDPCATGLIDLIPGASLAVLNGVKHFPSVEAPHETTVLIREFCGELSPW